MKVINLEEYIATKKIQEILDISKTEALGIIKNIKDSKSLAYCLREIGFKSVNQISYEKWEDLRKWRDNYFENEEI